MKQVVAFLGSVAAFFVLAIFQNSFLPHIFFIPNLVFVFFLVIVFLQRRALWGWKIAYAIAAGLFIDLFSLSSHGLYLGLAILVCLAVWGLVAVLDYFFNV